MSRNKIILWVAVSLIVALTTRIIYIDIKNGPRYSYPVKDPKKLNASSLGKNNPFLEEFKICTKEQMAKVKVTDTIFTYSKQLSDDPEWTYFKEIEEGGYNMYFSVPIYPKDVPAMRRYCYYDTGVFKDNMFIKGIPIGTPKEILFIKFDKKEKEYFWTLQVFGGKNWVGGVDKSPIHELRVYPQEMPTRNDGSHYEGSFFIKGLEKKPQ